MGVVVSRIASGVKAIKAIVGALRDLQKQYNTILSRAATPPGLPVPNPTRAFWQDDPPFPELVEIRSPALPDRTDVAIIGSGISGAAVARSLLHLSPDTRVVVLEARQLCSGATGRNGGHIKASPHETLPRYLSQGIPGPRAAALARFQLSTLGVLTGLCQAEGIDIAECREVETVDLYFEKEAFEKAQDGVEAVRKWMPEVRLEVWDGEAARAKFDANGFVVGAISYKAGALWPYRFVTAIWKRLLDHFPEALSIETGTPVESLRVDDAGAEYPYHLQTPRGTILAKNVVHATNGFTSHLLPKLQSKMVGLLATMSAQRPGAHFPDLGGSRSWSFIFSHGFDYITQRPTVDGVPGEVMVGGGFFQSENQGLDNLAVYDDSRLDALTCAHLEGVMPTVFAPKWGQDGKEGRTKALWSGVIGVTADMLPFVGRLDARITERKPSRKTGADAAEWITAAFIGDGMVWAWLCGTALGVMILGKENEDLKPEPGRPGGKVNEWLPAELLATYDRIQRIDLADLAENLM